MYIVLLPLFLWRSRIKTIVCSEGHLQLYPQFVGTFFCSFLPLYITKMTFNPTVTEKNCLNYLRIITTVLHS